MIDHPAARSARAAVRPGEAMAMAANAVAPALGQKRRHGEGE